jgi:DNA polymerase III alpha subunit (gram-positive type)
MSIPEKDIQIVDIETTGFSCQNDLIVEVAVVRLNLTTEYIIPEYSAVINEGIEKKKGFIWIFKNSSLTYQLVKSGKSFASQQYKLRNIINSHKTTAFNKSFDFRFLRSRGVEIKQEAEDPMYIVGRLFGESKLSVVDAWELLFNRKVHEAHRALSDAWMEGVIVYELIKRGEMKI